ncbi:MAG: hypothetical protein JKY94_17420 [Rhodobacteraceae bacterium]|nr:hypothetical protein [Paracoccaceae bacterium]
MNRELRRQLFKLERRRHWIKFHSLRVSENTIEAIETIQYYKPSGNVILDPSNVVADHLEITGKYRRTSGQELGFDKAKVNELEELMQKVATIQKECRDRSIPCTRGDSDA